MKSEMLGKIADKKLEKLGFQKTEDNDFCVEYVRRYENMFIQKLAILHKNNGDAIIQSYDIDLFDQKNIGNTCVGMTYKEVTSAALKLLSKGWKR